MAKQSKKSKKLGRNAKSGQSLRYRNENRHGKSHLRRIKKHLARYGASGKDHVALAEKERYEVKLGIYRRAA